MFGESSSSVKVYVAAITSTEAYINIPSIIIEVDELAAFLSRIQIIQATFETAFQYSQIPQGRILFRNGASRVWSRAFHNLSINCSITQAIIQMTVAL